jgi:hypothetical protein
MKVLVFKGGFVAKSVCQVSAWEHRFMALGKAFVAMTVQLAIFSSGSFCYVYDFIVFDFLMR